MTKYEWERQLKKGISGLPREEQQRVLDYYNELFADKIDAGLREQYIISEFGNPYDVANKILVDYYNGDKDNPDVDAYIYADSDEIDEAFDGDSQAVTELPKGKAEARSDVNVNASKGNSDVSVKESKSSKAEYTVLEENADDGKKGAENPQKKIGGEKKANGPKSVGGLVTILCVAAYLVLGACFNLWHPGWLIFLAMPCVITLIEAIVRRNWRVFAYPVFVVLVFLLIGFNLHKWHPAWIIFITIPLYYVLGDFITKNADGGKSDKKAETREKKDKPRSEEPKTSERSESPAKRKKSKGSSNAVAIFAKILMAICLVFVAVVVWWTVIGLFIGGIGMIIGGIGCIAGAFVGTANLLLAGAGIAVLGLGLICAFGMAALFKPCFNMCKSFVKTIKNSFSEKEVA